LYKIAAGINSGIPETLSTLLDEGAAGERAVPVHPDIKARPGTRGQTQIRDRRLEIFDVLC